MKPILTLIVMCMVFVAANAHAADKLGFVDIDYVFLKLPEAATIEQRVTTEFKAQIDDVNRLENDLKYFIEKQKRDSATMSNAEIQQLDERITALRQEYESKAKPLQFSLQRRQNEEREKILGRILQAINSVHSEGNYSYILDKNAVFAGPANSDISDKIVSRVSQMQ